MKGCIVHHGDTLLGELGDEIMFPNTVKISELIVDSNKLTVCKVTLPPTYLQIEVETVTLKDASI